ncbi:class I SAM-dependent methyltransferase [Alicyclobacillus kakegawensis]|uniref:class I SAM-dependent methyltransferase n=1 Tax=Alicyclobacillus kakegawensis TaxID=392012 RepID=UPI0008356B68|nr:methyltransferase domain-containing protein [Alicyclobacillus kakegawensis]
MEEDVKTSVQRQFSQNAKDYRVEPLFAQGDDLQYLLKAVPLTGDERVLDVATGAGHVALAFAPHVEQCVGIDLTDSMVEVATDFARERGIGNVHFATGDAEHLPFSAASFDLVTCRFAAHHFADVGRAVQEVARVLKPGGAFLLIDHYAPEDEALDTFVNHLDKLRDPSHVREHRLSEYQAWFADAGLLYREQRRWNLPLQFENWVQRARTPADMKRKLADYLREASPSCKETFCIQLDEHQHPVSFCLKCALVVGRKP